jgi:1,4-alpha-glucan branching enzyme
MTEGVSRPIGTFSLVLHTHLPWVAHHGAWPVGEEWLHQAFTGSWRRVLTMVETLAAQGHSDVLTLGITPVVAAMMDDPYCLAQTYSWAGRWQLRAEELALRGDLADLAAHERREATACLADLESRWLTGGLSSVLRPLVDAGIIELLGGPATHPFQPLLLERVAAAQLQIGLADAHLRYGHAPKGIWAPECGYAPGMEELYSSAGIGHFLVDGPAVGNRTGTGHLVGQSDVVCFARDRPVSQLIWSARSGYPGRSEYRDFHTFDHRSGFRPARVTGADVASADKRAWRPVAAAAAVQRDAADFVAAVVGRLSEIADESGRPGLVVGAFDTELFGHWWYEGPDFLAAVLRQLPLAGVRVATLTAAREAGLAETRIELGPSSWGAGQDWRVWDNERVAGMADESTYAQKRLLDVLDNAAAEARGPRGRDEVLDQLAREALLLTSSDWAFMVTRDSAADYARDRARLHAERFHALADAIERDRGPGDTAHTADRLAASLRLVDGPFGHLDARLI